MEQVSKKALVQEKIRAPRKKRDGSAVVKTILLAVSSLAMVYPLLWMISNSFKTADDIMGNPASLLPTVPNLSNFAGALTMAPFDLYVFNSAFTAIVIVVIQLLLSVLFAFGIVFYSFPGKKVFYGAILLTYMLPTAATYVPSYVILAKMGLLDSLTGLIVSNLASVFTIFLLVQNFKGVPQELLQAAQIEGANQRQLLFRVVVPFSKSTLITAGLINFVNMYNNYMWPSLITTSKSKMLISVGLNTFFTGQGNFKENLPRLMAANTLSVLPLLILFVVLQKWFIKGISDSGLKG